MKTLVVVTIACLFNLSVVAQNIVNIQLISSTSSNCQITLTPTEREYTTLSNVVFALKWRSSRNIAVGNPQPTPLIEVVKSGSVRTYNGWKYQLYTGCGFVAGDIQPVVLNIPRSGKGEIAIADDVYVQQLSVNGQYFVSLGGRNATGQITQPTLRTVLADQVEQSEFTAVVYYEPSLSRFVVKRDGMFYNLMGQRTNVQNVAELIVVRKY